MSKGKYGTKGKYEDGSAGSATSMSQGKLLGRGGSSGTGEAEEITAGTNLSFSGTTLNASGGGGTSIADAASFHFWPNHLYQGGQTSFYLNPAGRVFTYVDYIPFEFKSSGCTVRVAVAGTVDASMSVGIYSLDGNTLHCKREGISALAVGDSSGNWDGGSVTLSAGYYIIAAGSYSTANRPYIYASSATTILWTQINTHSASIGYGANTMTTTALPSTTGAITAASSQALPIMMLEGTA